MTSLANAKRQMNELNERLHTKCSPEYSFDLRFYKYVETDDTRPSAIYNSSMKYYIILCLYYKKQCISSVAANYDEEIKEMELVSKTLPEHEGKKFNLYLRFAFVYLMAFVRGVSFIVSYSVNPISTYTMYKYFHAKNHDLVTFVQTRGLTPETFTVENAKEFHQYYSDKYKHTRETAEQAVNGMLEETGETLENLGWDTMEEAIQFIMETTNKNDTKVIVLKIQVPNTEEEKRALLTKMDAIPIVCKNDATQYTSPTKKRKTRGGRKQKTHKKYNK